MQRTKFSRSIIALLTSLIILMVTVTSALASVQVFTKPVQNLAAAQMGAAPYVYAPQPLNSAFTIRTETAITWGISLAAGEPLWLAGVDTTIGEAPSTLGLVWTPEPSWWGVSWVLQLRSDAGLIPLDMVENSKNPNTVRLVQTNPTPDHRYETFFSYNQVTGAVALRVTDVTDQRVVYQGTHKVKPTLAQLYAGFGTPDNSDADLRFDLASLEVHARYLPVGTNWDIGAVTPEAVFLPLSRFDVNEEIALRLRNLDADATGEFRFVSEAQTTRVLDSVRAEPDKPTAITYVSAAGFPVGRSNLYLEYVEDGTLLMREAQSMRIGAIDARFGDVVFDRSSNLVSSELQLSSNGAIDEVKVSVVAQIDELIWNPQTLTYDIKPFDTQSVLDNVLDIPHEETPKTVLLQAALPERAGYWQVTYTAAVEQEIDLLAWNTTQYFTTYAAAVLEPGESFTIAVLPDTQYMTKTYKTVYTRMLQWIAEQAAERNIVLTLGLGDITDNNLPDQWVTAAQGMKLLDGIMPFILSQGNHDMIQPGVGVQNRNYSLMSDYFPLSKQPWITGTYAENRVENSYSLFNFQGNDYLILALEFGPSDEALAWANKIVAQYPQHKVILITHNYTGGGGGHSNSALNYDVAKNPETSVNGGPGIWAKLVRNHANFHLVLSGHIHNDSIPKQVMYGVNRNYVFEMLIDYQSDLNGGNGYFALFTFHADGRIEVQAYSPYQGQKRATWGNHFFINPANGRFEY